jgi:tetratricopeptide (TPR) repeat protein
MRDLGFQISIPRLEDLEYRPRKLRIPGRRRLEEISTALQSLAKEQKKDWRQFMPHVLFPEQFAAPATDGMVLTESERPALINATILFVDLMNSVALSTALSLWEYNDLINEYQTVLRRVLDEISTSYSISEHYLGGDQLAAFFYDPIDAGLHDRAVTLRRLDPDSPEAAEIDAELTRHRNRSLYGALRLAVAVKNAWIAHPRNVLRVETDQPVLDVGVGINTGNVVLQQRGDGSSRIEGFAINFAKRVEGFSRHGRYCRIMLSRSAYETFRGIVVENVMLKQRAFFESYTPEEGRLKGLTPGTEVFELKFFHRLAGFTIPPDQIKLYRQIFENDPTNIWAYANLINFHLFSRGELDIAQAIAERALYCNPGNEKIYFDLAAIHQRRGELDIAREYGLQCLRLNDQMDIAYEMLAEVELAKGASPADVISLFSRALALSPQCADLHLHLALQLLALGRTSEAHTHYDRAREIFPGLDERYPEFAERFR